MNSWKELREEYGLSQGQLSFMTDIPERDIKSWEEGKRKPPEYLFNIVSMLLGYMCPHKEKA